MFKKFVLATALVGSVFATGAGASAGDYAQAEPPPSPPRTAPIGDLSGSEPVATHAYVLRCEGWNQCESLQKFCAKDGGMYRTTHDNGGNDIGGACVKLWG